MKIYRFVRALYGNTAVLCGAGILLLSLLLASAQFLSAWHLGRIMDAVGAGLSAVLSEAAYLTGGRRRAVRVRRPAVLAAAALVAPIGKPSAQKADR